MFNILDYTSSLEILSKNKTWIETKCPVCLQKNFKINVKTGAYKCYVTNCSPKDIRSCLSKFNSFVKVDPYRTKDVYQVTYTEPKPIAIENFNPDKKSQTIEEKVVVTNEYTYYYYSPTQRTIRFLNKEGKKIVAPQYKLPFKKDTWLSGKGLQEWGMFKPNILSGEKTQLLLAAEGEKSVCSLMKEDYFAMTAPSWAWSEQFLTIHLEMFKKYSILYFRDNDKEGIKKAKLFKEAAWRNSIPCEVVNPADYAQTDELGYDIADYLLDESNSVGGLIDEYKYGRQLWL